MENDNSEIDMEPEDDHESSASASTRNRRKSKLLKLIVFFIILIIIIGLISHALMVYLAASSVDVTNQKVDSITSESVAEYEITFRLTLNNPTSTDIDIERLTYQAYLEDDFIGEGEKSDFTIEPGENDHTFKFTFNIYDLAGSVRTLFITDSATLKITGDVEVPVKLFGQWKVASVSVQYEYHEEISS